MRYAFLGAVILLGAVFAAACVEETPAPTLTPQPTPTVLSVNLSSELSPMRPAIAACAAEIGDTGVLVFEAPTPAFPVDALTVALQLGFPDGFPGEASLLGYEAILVVTGDGSFDPEETVVRALFSGKPENPSAVYAWIPLPETQSRRMLDAWMAGTPYSPDVFLAPGPGQLIERMKKDTNAIGVLPSAWVTQDFHTLFSLGNAPVLALTQDEPTGKLRELIGCLQGGHSDQ